MNSLQCFGYLQNGIFNTASPTLLSDDWKSTGLEVQGPDSDSAAAACLSCCADVLKEREAQQD